MEPTAMTAVFTLLTEFSAAMINIWGDVVEFLMTPANGICLVGLVAFLFVTATGGIKKLITGC